MKIRIIGLLVSAFIIGGITVHAQNVDFKASNFKDNKDGVKQAIDNIKQGDDLFDAGNKAIEKKLTPAKSFEEALTFYLKAQAFNPDNAELNYKIGKCYLKTFKKVSSIPYLEKAIKLDPDIEKEIYYLLGEAYLYDSKFDDAIKQYKIYETKLSNNQLEDVKKDVKKRISECNIGKELVANPKRVFVYNLKEINTEYPDYCSAITVDESMMIFNSKRPNTTGGKKDSDGDYFSDIYVSYRDKGKNWSVPQGIGEPLNSMWQDECLALSPDGQDMFVYKMETNGEVFKSHLNGDKWSTPEKLVPGKINSEFNETHASFSYDGIKIYFISDQQGNKDIFFSGNKGGVWGKGQKIGDLLNTEYEEGSIYMHPDGKTMYFASKGHNSMGGYDIFKSVQGPDGRWREPENMGYPINTPYDEMYFVVSANGRHAYVTSNREQDGVGDLDIYKIKMLGPVKPASIDNEDHLLASFAEPIQEASVEKAVQVETMNLTVLKGRTIDSFTKKPVEAEIEIVDNVKNEVIYTIKSNSSTGKFLLSLPAGINYGIAVKAKDYLFYSENFDLPATADYQMVEKDIELKNVCIGCVIILRNIFFDTGKWDLRPESTTELKRVIQLMKDIPQIKVEISGHTDNVGSESFNLKLSEDRAKSVVNYLTQNGVPTGRLVYKGYGSGKPLTSNATAEGKQLNRRTEFKIIEN